MICVQSSVFDNFTSLVSLQNSKSAKLIALLRDNFNISQFIPADFFLHFNNQFGRKRKFSLLSFLNALLIKSLFKISTISQLILFLESSPDLASYCNFITVPDETRFSKFLSVFADDINSVFQNLVSFSAPIISSISDKLSRTLILDTTGVLANVKENNPKFVNAKIKNLKSANKANKNFNPYSAAYSSMPKSASADSNIKLSFANGEFCYSHKFAVLTDGLGFTKSITALDSDFIYSNSPDSDKSLHDIKCLKPVLNGFFANNKNFNPYTFLGDSAFDSNDSYEFLMNVLHFKRVAIPLNTRNTKFKDTNDLDSLGYPFCKIKKLSFKFEGVTNGKNRSQRLKFVCPLASHDKKGKYVCTCDTPCSSSCCRMRYINAKSNLRAFPGIQRNTRHYDNVYKRRTVIERTINSLKDMSCYKSFSRNPNVILSDLLFAGIAQHVILILANALSLKSLKSFQALRKAA